MKSAVRYRFIALALIIFISQMLLLVHAISHIDKENVQCQLCVSQAQQSHSLPIPTIYIKVIQGHAPLHDIEVPAFPDLDPTRPYLQRAPPFIA